MHQRAAVVAVRAILAAVREDAQCGDVMAPTQTGSVFTKPAARHDCGLMSPGLDYRRGTLDGQLGRCSLRA